MGNVKGAAFAAAMVAASIPAAAWAEDQELTSGGDVTADEATVLPPIVVTGDQPERSAPVAPAPVRHAVAASAPQAVQEQAQEAVVLPPAVTGSGAGAVGVFTLGQLDSIGGSTITNETMWTYNKNTLDQALSIVPGVTTDNTGGSRNERDIYVRGFNRYRVPLYVDGVRIYLPADNRLDFNRFLTPDLSEIQVQKGYVSVLNGPGGMGGAINMVSRKPTKALELEGRAGVEFGGDFDTVNSWTGYAYGGTRQKHYYAQVSGTLRDQDHWTLSDDFTPILIENENGGVRGHSNAEDYRINAKVGITPNATDEYSINYTNQQGAKSAPLHVAGQVVQGPRFWDWLYWDTQSLSWLSKTKLGSASYVKTNAYYNTFDNLLSSYDDPAFRQQESFRSFDSYYNDEAEGGSIEFGTDLIPQNSFKTAVHYRRDQHQEYSHDAPGGADFVEPVQENVEETWSFAAENTFHATSRLDFIGGVAFNQLEVVSAEDYGEPPSGGPDRVYNYPTSTTGAWDYQGGAVYSYSDTGKLHATISDRTRFPTMFERFSTRFGQIVPNPDLGPERAVNYEVGASDTLFSSVQVSGALFYSDLSNSIQPVFTSDRGSSAIQNQNVDGTYKGVEFSVDWKVSPTVTVGGNYTYLDRDYDYEMIGPRPEGTPQHEGFIYLSWAATERWTLTPNIELASDRYSLITSSGSSLLSGPQPRTPNYRKLGSYALVNLEAEYQASDEITLALGATNLLDDNYELEDGFPEAGRAFFAKMRARF
ncbi:Ferrichrome-iron receptor precursor [Methyloligella halotolerans]|uniref:Ferrichrome-iron receptor n=1 Tax=Methyloligella halotolerans TaxID=1177755 RepID=A0A1E2RX31_9HYPH|nr:TonB-dependent receptor [Methyloligella halotolerans]ODA66781.1 Ferrichrome-iron receptor precursor [Methyloligella halotolerans]